MPLPPLAQFLLSDNPEMRQIYRYAVLVPIAIVVSLIIIFIVRRMAINRTRSLTSMSGGFMSLDRMRQQGLITDEEYRTMRQKMADRHLRETEADTKKTSDLSTLAMSPELARSLITHPPDERVRASLAGLGRKFDETDVEEIRRKWAAADGAAEDAVPAARLTPAGKMSGVESAGRGDDDASAPGDIEAPDSEGTAGGTAVRAAARRDYSDDPDFVPGDPLSDPRMSRAGELEPKAAPTAAVRDDAPPPASAPTPNAKPQTAAPAASSPAGRAAEIEDLFARGVISTEEYLRLRELVKRDIK